MEQAGAKDNLLRFPNKLGAVDGADYTSGSLFGVEATYPQLVMSEEEYGQILDDNELELPNENNQDACAWSRYWPYANTAFYCDPVIYYYHPDYGTSRATMARSAARFAIVMRDLGHTEYITDNDGEPYQYFHYTALAANDFEPKATFALPSPESAEGRDSGFGEALVEIHSNSGLHTDYFRFNGKELDPETGNYYYGARYYDPQVSVWLSVDPILKHHESPYSFTSNNPIRLIDPDGRDTSFADNQARKDFKSALNTVKSNVARYKERVDENKALADKNGIGAAVKRFFRNEKADARNLANWQKLESDFDNITSSETELVEYSSGGLAGNLRGSTQRIGGALKVKLGGNLGTVIHENRHVNQFFKGTTGSATNTDWFDELEAWQYQRIFDPATVEAFITKSGRNVHGTNWSRESVFFTLKDAVRYAHPNIANKTFKNLK